ncbi:hypothetical protein CEXT_482521 [Caerostris extrusa]|uniref:Copper transporter n=1 Tax=Caerostris extrusa TaxID=172846 RepID=A0AAV4MHG3_CAEEX|nr:hypothetical protein CEXT_482521 [Caerostris extrusa]
MFNYHVKFELHLTSSSQTLSFRPSSSWSHVLLAVASYGPFWAELPGVEVANCRHSGGPTFFSSITETHQRDADMQLHIIAVFVLIALYRNAYVGFAMAFFLVLGGSLAVGIITYVNDYEPNYFAINN